MTNDIGVSTRTMSRDIASLRYSGPSHSGTTLDFITDYGNQAGVELFPAIPFTWKKHSGMQTFKEMMDHTDFTPFPAVDENGNEVDIYKSVNRGPWKAPKVDRLMGSNYNEEFLYHPPDKEGFHPDDRMYGWLAQVPLIEYVSTPDFGGIVVANHEHQPDPVMNKFVTKVHYHGHNNEFGKYLSMSETVRQDWKKYRNSREGIELALQQSEDGEDVANIGVIPIEGAIYGIRRLGNGEILLFSGTNSYEALGIEMDMFGLTLEDAIIASLGEEDTHRFRISFDKGLSSIEERIGEERATKEELLEFYIQLAEDSGSNPRLRERYARIVNSIEHDIATVERYRELYKQRSKGGKKVRESEGTESSLEAAVEDSEIDDSGAIEDNIVELLDYETDSEQYDAEAVEAEGDCDECAEADESA